MYLDAGKMAHIMNIDMMESVVKIDTKQPTRYTIGINNGSYMVCGMKTKHMLVYALDLKNSKQEKKCVYLQKVNQDFEVGSMDYISSWNLLAVFGYFGKKIIEIYRFIEPSHPSDLISNPPPLLLLKTLDLGMNMTIYVKFLSPKELFVSTYGDGFNVYHCNFKKKADAAMKTVLNDQDKDTEMNNKDQKARNMRPARQLLGQLSMIDDDYDVEKEEEEKKKDESTTN
jgi:hypothetical protein